MILKNFTTRFFVQDSPIGEIRQLPHAEVLVILIAYDRHPDCGPTGLGNRKCKSELIGGVLSFQLSALRSFAVREQGRKLVGGRST